MILLDETSLTADQWAALADFTQSANYQVLLYDWNPQYTLLPAIDTRSNFTSAAHDHLLYRATPTAVEVYDSGWSDTGLPALSGVLTNAVPSLVSDGDLHLYLITASGISHATYTGSWSGWSSVVTDATVVFVAAVTSSVIHYVTYADGRYHLKVYDGSVHSSDIHLGYPIEGFQAARLNGVDTLVLTMEVPGIIGVKVVGTTTQQTYTPSGGIYCFQYKYGSWSNHYVVDNVDALSAFRYRSRIHLSVIEDTCWLVAYSSEGTAFTPITGYRVYSSRDGIHWSHGEYTLFPQSTTFGVHLVGVDHLLYAVSAGSVSTAPLTLKYGTPASVFDLSPYLLELHVEWRETQQLSLVVDNLDQWLADTLLDGDHNAALILKTGGWFEGDLLLQQVGVFELDSVEPLTELPVQTLHLVARDHLAWMTTLTQSEKFENWLPQIAAGDDYLDPAGTQYGGLGHTAPADGSWQTDNGVLKLVSNNTLGIAFSTFLYDNWNGAVEGWFKLALLGNGEEAGVLFRAQDKSNWWAFYYSQGDDKLRLVNVTGGSATTHWVSSTKGWSGDLNGHFLRAEYEYCRIRLYSSSVTELGSWSQLAWEEEQVLLIPGVPSYGGQILPDGTLVTSTTPQIQAGYVGVMGKGMSDTDTWEPPNVLPPELPPEFIPQIIDNPRTLSSPLKFWAMGHEVHSGIKSGHVDRLDLSTNWEHFVTGLPNPSLDAIIGATNPFSQIDKWVCFEVGLYRGQVWDVSPLFEEVILPSEIFPNTDTVFTGFYMSPAKEGFLLVTGSTSDGVANDLLGISHDYGATWRWTVLYSGAFIEDPLLMYPSGWDGAIYGLQGFSRLTGHPSVIYRSPAYGDVWGIQYIPEYGVDGYHYDIHSIAVPFRLEDGSPNAGGQTVFALAVDNSANPVLDRWVLLRSDDYAVTWQEVSVLPGFTGITTLTEPRHQNLYIHPTSCKYIKYGLLGYLHTSEDAGLTWNSINTGTDVGIVSGWAYNPKFALVYTTGASASAHYTDDEVVFNEITAPSHTGLLPPYFIEPDLLFGSL